MGQHIKELEKIFEEANRTFISKNGMLFETRVSERTLCGALMIEVYEALKETEYADYFVDVEYNRNVGGRLKTIKKTIQGPQEQIIPISCDLIVHSRGQNVRKDNLIALEMKKSTARQVNKDKDRIRLVCLTKSVKQDILTCGPVLPEHVCGYSLGIYYEIDFKRRSILIEYYMEGNCYFSYEMEI
ncbi:MAG: hypothetical protein UHS49_04865 [Faecalimonas sp.]|nr:hypothetical protein [Faecalimonas sp.]